jgi:hypothetical protein
VNTPLSAIGAASDGDALFTPRDFGQRRFYT